MSRWEHDTYIVNVCITAHEHNSVPLSVLLRGCLFLSKISLMPGAFLLWRYVIRTVRPLFESGQTTRNQNDALPQSARCLDSYEIAVDRFKVEGLCVRLSILVSASECFCHRVAV